MVCSKTSEAPLSAVSGYERVFGREAPLEQQPLDRRFSTVDYSSFMGGIMVASGRGLPCKWMTWLRRGLALCCEGLGQTRPSIVSREAVGMEGGLWCWPCPFPS